MPVEAEVGFTAEPYGIQESANLVLHLHGSLLVYTRDYAFGQANEAGIRWMERKDPPEFMFDPSSLGDLFHPFTRVVGGLSYNPLLADRVIAPIPSKAEGLREAFVSAVKQRAVERIRSHPLLVSLGYAFAETDRGSYADLVEAHSQSDGATVVLVDPQAARLAARLGEEFPEVTWVPQEMSFADWVNGGYPGV